MRVVVHGNCQATAIATLLREAEPDWDIASWPVHTLDVDRNLPAYRASVEQADVVFAIPVETNYRGHPELSLAWVRDSARRTITYPTMCWTAHFPSLGWGMDGVAPFIDAHLVAAYLCGASPQDYAAELNRPDFLPADFVRREAARAVRAQQMREAQVDVPILPILDVSTHQFLTFSHPKRAVLAEVCNRLLRRAGGTHEVEPEGGEPLHGYASPIFRAISAATGVQPFAHVYQEGVWRSLEEEASRYFALFNTLASEDIWCRLDPHGRAYLKRFASAAHDRKHIMTGLFRFTAPH